MSRIIDNNGIGALYATFEIPGTGDVYDLTIDNVGDAVALSGNNKISHTKHHAYLLGRLEHVSGGLGIVQIAGVMRLNYTTTAETPTVGYGVIADRFGRVCKTINGVAHRGIVLAVDTTKYTCDVLI